MSEDNTIWVEVRTNDSCMWRLKGDTYEGKPSLEEMQAVVGGSIEYLPLSYLASDIKAMVVNEEGVLNKLDPNQLASQQLSFGAGDTYIVGDALLKVNKEFVEKEYWFKEE